MEKGLDLIKRLSCSTGLPEELVVKELRTLAHRAGISSENVTLEDFRKILSLYMKDVLIKAKADLS